jgi:transitional endoplasmic reticulum ATPase
VKIKSEDAIRLIADDIDSKDQYRCIVRVDPEIMKLLQADIGDVIGIRGGEITCARVMMLQVEERGNSLIQMDSLVMINAQVKKGDEVEVFRALPSARARIVAVTGELSLTGSRGIDAEQIKKSIVNHCIHTGDHFLVRQSTPGKTILTVLSTIPEGFVIIDESTRIVIKDKKSINESDSFIGYKDIGGLNKQISRIKEIVEYPVKYGKLFGRLGLEPARGILLYGPPGTGKTLIAKAIANEVNARFICVNGPEIINKYYGESEARIREIFEEAQKNMPSIIFIDEIDAIAPKRDEVQGDVEKRIVAQLLSLMDGVRDRSGVVVIGATNMPNSLDPAIRRPGRFDREIYIGVPDENARYEILKIHTDRIPLDGDVDLARMANITHGYVGADLKALCTEAAMNCIRRQLESNTGIDRDEAIEEERICVSYKDFSMALAEIQPSAIREVTTEVPYVTWNMIGGLEEIKSRLRECIEWPLKYPEVFTFMNIKSPRGILLYGPPGTGKTLVAQAIANESGVNFIPVKGPELLSKWQGETEKGVREIFRKAKLTAPCIIFFDEIDSLIASGEYAERSNSTVLAQLLTEMDGIEALDNVMIIGATNRIEAIDKALLRDGRFDELLEFKLPDAAARRDIFKLHLKNRRIDPDVDLEELILLTEGYSGAEIGGVCRKAALKAVRNFMEDYGDRGDFNFIKIHKKDIGSIVR